MGVIRYSKISAGLTVLFVDLEILDTHFAKKLPQRRYEPFKALTIMLITDKGHLGLLLIIQFVLSYLLIHLDDVELALNFASRALDYFGGLIASNILHYFISTLQAHSVVARQGARAPSREIKFLVAPDAVT